MRITEPFITRRQRLQQSSWFGGWFIITVIAAFLKPSPDGHGTHQQLGLPPCPSVLLFDRPCPGCGLTTSWTATVHGDFAMAFHAHPLGPILFGLFTLTAWWGLICALNGVRIRTELKAWDRYVTGTVAFAVLFGFVRFAITPHYAAQHERIMASALRGN